MSSDTTSPTHENQESGLWLWHGEAPPPPPRPPSRVQRSLDPIVSALRRGGWIVLPGGVALTLLAVMLRSTPPDESAPADIRAVTLEPVQSPADVDTVIPAPSANIPTPRVEHTDTQSDQAHMPSAAAAPLPPRGTEHQLAKKAAHRSSARAERKTHVFADRGSPFLIHGVLTPPESTASH